MISSAGHYTSGNAGTSETPVLTDPQTLYKRKRAYRLYKHFLSTVVYLYRDKPKTPFGAFVARLTAIYAMLVYAHIYTHTRIHARYYI